MQFRFLCSVSSEPSVTVFSRPDCLEEIQLDTGQQVQEQESKEKEGHLSDDWVASIPGSFLISNIACHFRWALPISSCFYCTCIHECHQFTFFKNIFDNQRECGLTMSFRYWSLPDQTKSLWSGNYAYMLVIFQNSLTDCTEEHNSLTDPNILKAEVPGVLTPPMFQIFIFSRPMCYVVTKLEHKILLLQFLHFFRQSKCPKSPE